MGITTREFGPNAKGSKLTIAEMDENFNYLDNKPSTGPTGPTGPMITIKTINGDSLVGSGNVIINPARSRVIGMATPGVSYGLINFGSILNGSRQLIDVDIQGDLWTNSTGNLRIYASSSSSSVIGAILLGTYTLPSGVSPSTYPASGRFVRRFTTYNISGTDDDGNPYADYYIVGIDPNVSVLNDSVFNNAEIISTFYGNLDGINTYLVAQITSSNSNAKFIGWTCEYGQ